MNYELRKTKKIVAIALITLLSTYMLGVSIVSQGWISSEWMTQNKLLGISAFLIVFSATNIYCLGVYFVLKKIKEKEDYTFSIIQIPIAVALNTILIVIAIFVLWNFLSGDYDVIQFVEKSIWVIVYGFVIKDIIVMMTLFVTFLQYRKVAVGKLNSLQKSILWFVLSSLVVYVLSFLVMLFIPSFISNPSSIDRLKFISILTAIIITVFSIMSTFVSIIIYYYFFHFSFDDNEESIQMETTSKGKVFTLKVALIVVYILGALLMGTYSIIPGSITGRVLFNPTDEELIRRANISMIVSLISSSFFTLSILVFILKDVFSKNGKPFLIWAYIILFSTQFYGYIYWNFVALRSSGAFNHSLYGTLFRIFSFLYIIALIVLFIRTLKLEKKQKNKYLSWMILVFILNYSFPLLLNLMFNKFFNRHWPDYTMMNIGRNLQVIIQTNFMVVFFVCLLLYKPFINIVIVRKQKNEHLFGEKMMKLIDDDKRYDIFGNLVE